MMRRLVLLAVVACKSGGGQPVDTTFGPTTSTSTFAAEDEPAPSYGKSELQSALITERGVEASAERQIGELETGTDPDALRIAHDDLAVRRRYIATLEHCEAEGKLCPPRLDDPAWT